MYRKASKMKLRFITERGNLSVEDLWGLSLQDLDKVAIALDRELEHSAKKSFISEVTPTNSVNTLKFDIVKDIISDKLTEKAEKETAKEKKAEKARLLEILARKQDQSLENMSESELLKKIQELD